MAHQPHLGLRAQIRNYFGKHATFSVHIHIHELANIPLVTGDFACRWRVKGAQPLSSQLERRDSASGKSVRSDETGSASGSGSHREGTKKGQGHAINPPVDADIEVQIQPPSPPMNPTSKQGSISTTISLSESNWSSPSESSDGKPSPGLLQPDGTSSSHDHGSSTEDGRSRTPTASVNGSSTPVHGHHHALGLGRGRTETVGIIDHTVRWDEIVELAAHMGISKETKGLLPSELKLVVEQVPQPQEHLVKAKTTLGVVQLNLAEYVGKGAVTRRYLLRESKTNATLKLTIHIKHLSGEHDYVAPPLQKAQIMEGVAGLMSNDRILPPGGMRTPSRPLLSSPSSGSSFYNIATPDLPLTPGVNRGRAGSLSRAPTLSPSLSFTRPTTPGPAARTEQIIEALFNPVPTTNPNPSPFAYYAPSRPPVRRGTANVTGVSELDSSWSLVKAQQDAQGRALLQVPITEEPLSTDENSGWWKRTVGKAGKRPSPLQPRTVA